MTNQVKAEQPKTVERFATKPAANKGPKRDRSKRLLDMVMLLLQSRIPVSFRQIRDQFVDYQTANAEAGLRAFERDKADLLELGVPIRYITPEEDDSLDEGGYVIEWRAYQMPPLQFTPEEISALVMASSMALAAPGGSYPKIVDLAVKKLAFDLPETADTPGGLLREVTATEKSSVLYHFPEANEDPKTKRKQSDWFAQMERAVQLRKRVSVEYQSISSLETSKRDVDPYGLIYQQGVWLLVGHCHLRSGIRIFRIDRIKDFKIAPKPKSPDFERPTDFDIRRYVTKSPWCFGNGESEKVTLEVKPLAAEVLLEDFGPDAVVKEFGATKQISFQCRNLDYAVSKILQAKGNITIVSGEKLKKQFRAELAKIRGLYQ